jgi:heavy metal-binding protein
MKVFLLATTVFCFIHGFGQQKLTAGFFCAACGCKKDRKVFDQPGSCPLCGMKLQQVGTFNFEMTDLCRDDQIIAFKTPKPDGVGRIFVKTPAAQRIVGDGSMPQISPDKKWVAFEADNNQILLYDISKDRIIDISPTLEGLQKNKNLFHRCGNWPHHLIQVQFQPLRVSGSSI